MKPALICAIAALAFATTAPVAAQSTDTPEAREAAVARYMRAVPTEKMMEDTYTELAKQLPADKRASFIADMRKLVKVDAIERLAKAAMLRHFTADELNALADFYSSRHGASAMSKFGVYMADVMPPLMQEIQRAVQEMQAGGKP